MKPARLITLGVSPLIGCLAGYGLASAMAAGWLSNSWEALGSPPEQLIRFLEVSEGEVWLSTASGAIYHWPSSHECRRNCWLEVPDLPPTPTPDPYVFSMSDEQCTSPPPLLGVSDQMSECLQLPMTSRTTTFAVREDGAVFRWSADVMGEGTPIVFLTIQFIGALGLFLVTFIWVLFLQLLDTLADRARRHAPQSPPPADAGNRAA